MNFEHVCGSRDEFLCAPFQTFIPVHVQEPCGRSAICIPLQSNILPPRLDLLLSLQHFYRQDLNVF